MPGVFPGGKKRPVRKADNLPPSCAVVMKSGSLNFLESSGPVEACNGTALPFYTLLYIYPFLKRKGPNGLVQGLGAGLVIY